MAQPTKIKVNREELIEVLQHRLVQLEDANAAAIAANTARLKALQAAIKDALKVAAKSSDQYEVESHYYDGLYVKVPVDFDVPVEAVQNTATLERLIKTLQLGADTTVLLSADDAARYLG